MIISFPNVFQDYGRRLGDRREAWNPCGDTGPRAQKDLCLV